jgi:hypothetical protein
MPGAAVAEGAVCDELPLSDIASYILRNDGLAETKNQKGRP